MNISTYSPALTLLYVFILLCILMDVDLRSMVPKKRRLFLSLFLLLCTANHVLRFWMGTAAYGKTLLFTLHLPTFIIFSYIEKRGMIKTAFMIFTALVFTAPTVIIGNFVRHLLPDSSLAFLVSNLISYGLMLLLAQYVFRKSFNYLIKHGDNRFFLLFSLVPFIYYLYVIGAIGLDMSQLSPAAGFLIRYLPTINAFLLYFLFPFIYRTLNEKHETLSIQTTLEQQLASAEDQISLLNEAHTEMKLFRHDIRHRTVMLNSLLDNGDIDHAKNLLREVVTELDSITPKKFCENEMINLLCSSYSNKAKQRNIGFTTKALLPKELPLSDAELCSMISNGLENALHAASHTDVVNKWMDFYSEVKQNKLLIQIRNSYSGQITMKNDRPVSHRAGHGYGCLSIQTIAQRNGGLCSFKANDGVFTLQLIIPFPSK